MSIQEESDKRDDHAAAGGGGVKGRGEDHVSPESLPDLPRQQTNPPRWDGTGWLDFVKELLVAGVEVKTSRAEKAVFVTDAGGIAHGMPHGVVRPGSAEDISKVMRAAQIHRVPVTVRGGGLTTEGEAIAFGGLMLDMTSMNGVVSVDREAMTVRVEAGIFWHTLAEELRKDGLDYLSAPLNMTSTVGGVTAVGGVDINSPRLGTSADQVVSMKAVTPTGEIIECSEESNRDLFEGVLYGYGQFAVMAEATLKIRTFTPMRMRYFYYSSLEKAVDDLRVIVENDASDYSGILTIMDKAINLLVGFDTDDREMEFDLNYAPKLSGYGELGFLLRSVLHYALRPWKMGEALYLLERRLRLFPELHRGEFMRDGKIYDRTVLFSRAVWKFWGGRKMVIPDLSATKEKFSEAVVRGNAVCRKYFKHYTLYCVGIRHFGELDRYELSCMPPGAEGFVYGCEFEPVLKSKSGTYDFSRDHIQSFKNEIYDIGLDMGLGYYRFGGMMKGYIRRAYGDEVVDRHLEAKRVADPAMILNRESVF